MNTYRDALEAAQQRAADLDRELAELRDRNQRLEAERAGGDTAEELANARRFEVALERERAELRQREQADAQQRVQKTQRAKAWQAVLVGAWIGAMVLAGTLSTNAAAVLLPVTVCAILALIASTRGTS